MKPETKSQDRQMTSQVVLASAGSGKTFALTNRFIELLARGEEAGSILAMTFTKKAAGEILERVLLRLARAVRDQKGFDELRQHVEIDLTRAKCQSMLAALIEDLPKLSVQTIDSFFSKLAKAMATELGLSSNWEIIEPEIEQSLMVEAVSMLIEKDKKASLLGTLALKRSGLPSSSVIDAIQSKDALYQVYLATVDQPEVWDQVQPTTRKLTDDEFAKAIETLDALTFNPDTKSLKRVNVAHEKAIGFLRNRDWSSFLSKGFAANIVSGKAEYYKNEITQYIVKAHRPLIDHAINRLVAAHRHKTLATLQLLNQLSAHYETIKREQDLLSFADVPRRLLESGSHGNVEHLYYRLDGRVRHVLLDEFQDTSINQFRLIEPMIDEILAHGGHERTVFCVGDIKQSLYGWRNAEPALLEGLTTHWPVLEPQTLSKSYRSSSIVIDAVNQVFTDLAQNPVLACEPAAAQWQEGFTRHEAHHTDLPGLVRLVVAEEYDEADDDWPVDDQGDPLKTEIVRAVRTATAWHNHNPKVTIGILVRQSKFIGPIVDLLAKGGTHASRERGEELTNVPIVRAALAALQLAEHPQDSASVMRVALSPLGRLLELGVRESFEHVAAVASKLRWKISQEGIAPVLWNWLARLSSQTDSRGMGRFVQLIDLAHDFDSKPHARISEFLTMVDNRPIDDPQPCAIRVMTIHGSKGLEFDGVILPDLGKQWSINKDSILVDRPAPFADIDLVTLYPSLELRKIHGGLQDVYRRTLTKNVREELCCLYVAMTRAACSLEMIVTTDQLKVRKRSADQPEFFNAAGVLRAGFKIEDDTKAGQVLYETGSADWLDQIPGGLAELGEVEKPLPPVRIKLLEATGSSVRCRMQTPSAMGHEKQVKAGAFFESFSAALKRGSLLHAWFEAIHWMDDGQLSEDELNRIAAELGWSPADLGDLRQQFYQALSANKTTGVLSRSWYQARCSEADEFTVYREWPFAIRITSEIEDEGGLIAGQFDRLVAACKDGRPIFGHVIDYKSDRIASAADRDRVVEQYKGQLLAYRNAACSLLALPGEAVEVGLFLIDTGEYLMVTNT